ncbi:DUF4280 domain-containing protein [Aquimarina sp. RZ0]|uniref:DUF4280 domain-containing protein n=1 Tax=Aquimarina sp. RZ0 TaxID=2607730 RepID=UPI0011F21004|nr:DUF4280 domain-containing protein [Aquimarina sp. RZ0]KAA1242406.1 DUF4280 domain-containing protein [Aquimarina sp. RZ0]
MSQKKVVCHGALCKCQFGDVPDTLTVLSQQKNYINDQGGSQKLIATDKELGMPFQAKTFGQCKLQPTGSSFKPCMPNITKWDGAFQKTQLQANQGFPLLEDNKATCAIAGSPCVEITFHGQTASPSSQNAENTDEELISQVLPINVREIDMPSPYDAMTVTDKESEEEAEVCRAIEPSAAPESMIGTCQYYKWRFENFMERHHTSSCKHDPPDYYYGTMRAVEGGYGIIDGIQEWWTPSLEEEMGNEQLTHYKRGHGTFKAVPSKSYGYKYCVRFTNVLMPTLSEEGKQWLKLAKILLQEYMEEGVINKSFSSVKNESFNERYRLNSEENLENFYTEIENRNDEFRDFAFATHPDAYLDAGLTGIPISDKIKVSMTPDFKEWGSGKTWEQAMIVFEEQIDDWYSQAKAGVEEAQRVIEDAIEDAERYLELYKDAYNIWKKVNRALDKYRDMPWIK